MNSRALNFDTHPIFTQKRVFSALQTTMFSLQAQVAGPKRSILTTRVSVNLFFSFQGPSSMLSNQKNGKNCSISELGWCCMGKKNTQTYADSLESLLTCSAKPPTRRVQKKNTAFAIACSFSCKPKALVGTLTVLGPHLSMEVGPVRGWFHGWFKGQPPDLIHQTMDDWKIYFNSPLFCHS